MQQRRFGGRLHVRLRGEQADQARLADDLALGAHDPHPDVVHPRAPVHRRVGLGLRDDEELPLLDPATDLRVEGVQAASRRRTSSSRRRTRIPEPGARDRLDRAAVGSLGEPVLPVPEEHEVQLEEPVDEVGRLADLLRGIGDRRLACQLAHMPDALLHRFEVADHEPDVVQDRAKPALEVGAIAFVQASLELDVDHRLAMRRVAPGEDLGDEAVLGAPRADHRVQQQACLQVAGVQLLGDRVDEERRVVGARLDHGAGDEVAVGLQRRHEHADARRVVAAAVDEGERRSHAAEELRRPERLEVFIGQPAQEHLREDQQGVASIGRSRGRELVEEGVHDGRDGLGSRDRRRLGGGGFGSGLGHVRAPRSVGWWFRLSWNPYGPPS